MNILQDILGLITKGKVKTPTNKDYIVVASYTDAQEILKPQPKMQANLVSVGALKTFIQSSVGSTSTLQQVLDNNHDLVSNNNFQGTGAGLNNTGNDVNAFGPSAAEENTGAYINAFGFIAGAGNIGINNNFLGGLSGNSNQGNNVNAFGYLAGSGNSFSNVNLFGENAQADENGQTVLSKDDTTMARISTTDLTATRKYNLPDDDGTIALTSDIPIPPYKVYTAIVTAWDNDAPSAIELENTIGTITITKEDTGRYKITSDSLFTEDKTVLFYGSISRQGEYASDPQLISTWQSANFIRLDALIGGVESNFVIWKTPIEIRVYN